MLAVVLDVVEALVLGVNGRVELVVLEALDALSKALFWRFSVAIAF